MNQQSMKWIDEYIELATVKKRQNTSEWELIMTQAEETKVYKTWNKHNVITQPHSVGLFRAKIPDTRTYSRLAYRFHPPYSTKMIEIVSCLHQ